MSQTNKVNLIKKISVNKVIGGKPKIAEIVKFFAENPEAVVLVLARFFGTANGTKTGVSDFGEWTALAGQFRGINVKTGETFDSGVCFLPDVALDLIVGAMGQGSVDFAFDIGVTLDEDSATGYVYTATPLIQEENNPIARLASKLESIALPSLPAPASEEKAKK